MFGLGMPELIVIFLVVFLLFGAKALPEIAKGLGQAIKAFRKEKRDIEDDMNSDLIDIKKSSNKKESDTPKT